jgi:hypothetical protein
MPLSELLPELVLFQTTLADTRGLARVAGGRTYVQTGIQI